MTNLQALINGILEQRKSFKLTDVQLMETMQSVREKLSVTDLRDVDKKIRDAELMKPPGTGKRPSVCAFQEKGRRKSSSAGERTKFVSKRLTI